MPKLHTATRPPRPRMRRARELASSNRQNPSDGGGTPAQLKKAAFSLSPNVRQTPSVCSSNSIHSSTLSALSPRLSYDLKTPLAGGHPSPCHRPPTSCRIKGFDQIALLKPRHYTPRPPSLHKDFAI